MSTERRITDALTRGGTGVLTNSCLTKSGQTTFPGVYFAQFTQTEHMNDSPVGAATADPEQLRWNR